MAGHSTNLDNLPVMLILNDGAAAPAATAVRMYYHGTGTPGTSWSTSGRSPYRTQHHSMQLVRAGSGGLEIDGSWQEFRPGQVVLVPGQRWLRRRGDPGMALSWIGFGIEPLALDLRLGGCDRILVLPAAAQPVLVAGIEAAARAHEPLAAARTAAALHLAVALLLEAAGDAVVPDPDPAVLRARDHIERHYLESPSLAAIARAAGRSAHHLHQRFAAAVGCTPSAYAQRLRLRDAQALLLGGELPVAEVARRCGYGDPFHFARVMRRECGISPSGLRKRR